MSFAPMPDDLGEITRDAILGGRLTLAQPARGHRFGHDAILLAAAVRAKPGERAVELGAGVGAAGLALLSRVPDIDVTLVEIDPRLVALAQQNIESNGFAKRARAIALDAGAPARDFAAAGLAPDAADHVLMNPPFHGPSHRPSPDRLRRAAHAAREGTLARWAATALRLLRAGGHVALIWRADGLQEALSALAPGFGGIEVLPVHGVENQPAIRLILRGIKASRAPLAMLPAIALNRADGAPTAQAEAVLRGGASLG